MTSKKPPLMVSGGQPTTQHQHLYGSNRYLKQNAARCATNDHSNGVIPPSSANKSHCLLQAHQQQQQQQSQSITVLPNLDFYDSYGTLPIPAYATGRPTTTAATTTTCNRHLDQASINHSWYPNQGGDSCCLYNVNQVSQVPVPVCMCGNSYHQQQQHHQQQHQHHQYQRAVVPPPPVSNLLNHPNHQRISNGYYFGYDHGNHLTDEEDSAFPVLPEREFHMLHRNIPALRRTGVDTTAIRQYFYPDGGWGWIICGVSFLVHILTTGLQLSYGLLMFYAMKHLQDSNGIEWLGALSWSISMLVTPFVVTFCRKKSTRLLAIVGGLVLPLSILFTSFATEMGQVIFSYGIVFGIGVAMVRESSTIMLGNYFKRRRQFVEMVAMSGEGVGIALFSVILKEGVDKAGWRLGLQIIAAIVAISFFIGFLYRPASLYHPQRRAIQHLKNQHKKMREKKLPFSKTEKNANKYLFIDISPLKSATVKVLLMTSGIAALGIYTPMFTMSLHAAKDKSDIQDLVLLQTFLGMSTVLGVVISGALVRRPFRIRQFLVTTQVVSQVFISTVAIAILFLSFVMGYKGLCILSWIFGIGFGGFRYSMKILALERIKLRQFSKAWGLIKGIECIPVLISVPLTIFLNDYSLKYGRAGYYICSAAAAIAGIIIFFISYSNYEDSTLANRKPKNTAIPKLRTSTHQCRSNFVPQPSTAEYVYNGCDEYPTPDLVNRSCISLNQLGSSGETAYRNFNCGRLRMQCFNQMPYNVLEHNSSNNRTAQYHFGQGSVNARTGRRLQRSLSFIQNPYCYGGQWHCNCYNSYNGSHRDHRTDTAQTQSLLCTCSPTSYLQNSRSRSVPEGLSSMSQQCSCKRVQSREVLYLPRMCSQQPKDIQVQHTMPSTTPRHRQQRSHSLSKPIHFVEQITTSV